MFTFNTNKTLKQQRYGVWKQLKGCDLLSFNKKLKKNMITFVFIQLNQLEK